MHLFVCWRERTEHKHVVLHFFSSACFPTLPGFWRRRSLGFYMVAAVSLQLATGWARARALEAKEKNFSLFHRVLTTDILLRV